MHCFALNFYSFISGDRYYLKAANDLCSNIERISTMDECKSATNFLKVRGLDIDFANDEESSTFFPKGCYKYSHHEKHVQWNTHNSGSANRKGQPICKKGE